MFCSIKIFSFEEKVFRKINQNSTRYIFTMLQITFQNIVINAKFIKTKRKIVNHIIY